MNTRSKCLLAGAVVGVLGGAVAVRPENKVPDRSVASLAEARRMVSVMNDVYVTGTLMAHEMYVREAGDPAAVTWAKQVIRRVNAQGGPEARLFSAGSRYLNPENKPADPFEEAAVASFEAGKESLERTTPREYRYATVLRITDQSCLTCHTRNRVGDVVGGISYRVAISGGK